MSDETDAQTATPGSILWRDLTVAPAQAEGVRDFYARVVGWQFESEDMGGYSDFSMVAPASGQRVAGICHARGANANLPAQWLIYIVVADLEASVQTCRALGGQVVDGPCPAGAGCYCVIQDPAGAVAALYQLRSED